MTFKEQLEKTREEIAKLKESGDPIHGEIASGAIDQIIKEKVEKESLLIRDKRNQIDIKAIQVELAEKAAIDGLDLDNLPQTYIDKQIEDYDEYLLAAKNRIKPQFSGFEYIPLFGKNLLFFGARTGHAKSSTQAQMHSYNIQQKNRSLIITNEETAAEAYTRVLFMLMEWKFEEMDKITDHQKTYVMKFMQTMHNTKQLIVIDDNHPTISRLTTSIEGLRSILESIYKQNNNYSLISIDYFSKLGFSKENPRKDEWRVLADVGNLLDEYRRKLNCAIVVFGQLHPANAVKVDFEDRIKRFKDIVSPMTFCCEIEPDAKNYKTNFIVHKNRFIKKSVGTKIVVGYNRDKKMYVEYDDKFINQAKTWKASDPVETVEDLTDDEADKTKGEKDE